MIFLPNKIEKYTYAFRNTFQFLISKNGIKENYLKSLRKICEAEILFNEISNNFIVCKEHLYQLLTAIFIKQIINNKEFDFIVDVKGNFLVDKKLFHALILNIAEKSKRIEILEINNKIIIKFDLKVDYKTFKFIKKLNGQILTEIKNEITLVVLSVDFTDKKTEENINAFDMLKNPLSDINVYL